MPGNTGDIPAGAEPHHVITGLNEFNTDSLECLRLSDASVCKGTGKSIDGTLLGETAKETKDFFGQAVNGDVSIGISQI